MSIINDNNQAARGIDTTGANRKRKRARTDEDDNKENYSEHYKRPLKRSNVNTEISHDDICTVLALLDEESLCSSEDFMDLDDVVHSTLCEQELLDISISSFIFDNQLI